MSWLSSVLAEGTASLQSAWIGLIGVSIGALLSLIASALIPWLRASIDRRQLIREDRRDALVDVLAALLEYRRCRLAGAGAGEALAKYGAVHNALVVRLTPAEEPVLQVLYVMLAWIQQPGPDVENRLAQAMLALTRWARDELPVERVLGEVEAKASVRFSADRTTVSSVPPAGD